MVRLKLTMALAAVALAGGCATLERITTPQSTASSRDVHQATHTVHNTGDDRILVRVTGDSMLPKFGDGTLVVVEETPFGELKEGMTVVYRASNGDFVVHNLVRQSGGGWIARGINNPSFDKELVTGRNYIGVVYGTFFPGAERPQGR